MPPNSRTKLATETTIITPVGTFPTSLSGGQLFVYVMTSPGRSVTHAQVAQKKKAVSWRACSGVATVPAGIA